MLRQTIILGENTMLIVGGIFFLISALINFRQMDLFLKPKYKDAFGRKRWQRERSIFQFMIGINCFLYFFIQSIRVANIVVGLVTIILIIIMAHRSHKFMRNCDFGEKKEDPPPASWNNTEI